jgi:hypothetical protein
MYEILNHLLPQIAAPEQFLKGEVAKRPTFAIELITAIKEDALSDEAEDCLAPFFRVVGLSTEDSIRFISEFHKVDDSEHKQHLLACVFHTVEGKALFDLLSEEERIDYSSPWIRPMMRLAMTEIFPRHALAALYASTSKEHQPRIVLKMEAERKRVNADAQTVYKVCNEIKGFALPF